jgi:hypothetical protein
MQCESASNQNGIISNANQPQRTPSQTIHDQRKDKFLRLNVDFSNEADLAMGLSIISALHKEMDNSLKAIEAEPQFQSRSEIKAANKAIIQRCVSCSERNHQLLVNILKVKEELIVRMYMGKNESKSNQIKLNSLMAEIRRAKYEINEKLKETQIRRLTLKTMPQHFDESECEITNQDYNVLRNGL